VFGDGLAVFDGDVNVFGEFAGGFWFWFWFWWWWWGGFGGFGGGGLVGSEGGDGF
jgi:hypothetical protein